MDERGEKLAGAWMGSISIKLVAYTTREAFLRNSLGNALLRGRM